MQVARWACRWATRWADRKAGRWGNRRAGSSRGTEQSLGACKALTDPQLLPGYQPLHPAAFSVFPKWSTQNLQHTSLPNPHWVAGPGLSLRKCHCPQGATPGHASPCGSASIPASPQLLGPLQPPGTQWQGRRVLSAANTALGLSAIPVLPIPLHALQPRSPPLTDTLMMAQNSLMTGLFSAIAKVAPTKGCMPLTLCNVHIFTCISTQIRVPQYSEADLHRCPFPVLCN